MPVRGSPVTKIGRSIGTSACSGYWAHAASLGSLAVSAPRSRARVTLMPYGVSPASRA